MKFKIPEFLTLILVLLAVLFPPWKLPLGDGLYRTEHGFFVWNWNEESLYFSVGRIDSILLLIELVAIAGVYFLLKRITDKGGDK